MSLLPDSCVLRGCDLPMADYSLDGCLDASIQMPVISALSGTLTDDLPVNVAATMTVEAQDSALQWQWSVSSGALPTGMALTSDGEQTATISGTPTVTGTFSFTLMAISGWGMSSTRSYSVTVI